MTVQEVENGLPQETVTEVAVPTRKQCSSCREYKTEDAFFPSGWVANSAQCKACIAQRGNQPRGKGGRPKKAAVLSTGNFPSGLQALMETPEIAIVKEVIAQRNTFDLAVIEMMLKRKA